MPDSTRQIGIYIHIPFCKTLCPYCDFIKERTSDPVPDSFIDALLQEIENFEGATACKSVFLGGGTPSLLRPESLNRIFSALNSRFRITDAEITLEANPDDITLELAEEWKEIGVNRISLGVQSFSEQVLRYLGRRHNADIARRAIDIVGNTFPNWSFDLIFGAPPVEDWLDTLKEAAAISPPHIAAYGLTYEAGTPFERKQSEAINQDDSLKMYRKLEEALEAYEHYEISNFAKPGCQSLHNLIYWHNSEYAGFGTGAYSYINGVRARNHTTTDTYLKAPGDKKEVYRLSPEEQQVETFIQYMRLENGMPLDVFPERFGVDVDAVYHEEIKELIHRGLLTRTETHLKPTPDGFYLNNEIGLMLVDSDS